MLKIVMNYYCFQIEISCSHWEGLVRGGLSFFSFGFSGGQVGNFCFFWVCSNVFPLCLHQVPKVFPKMFPITLPFLSHTKRATTSIYITCKREGRGSKACLCVGYLVCWGVPPCSKNIDDGPNGLEFFFRRLYFCMVEYWISIILLLP
jgi:hypothetical protein